MFRRSPTLLRTSEKKVKVGLEVFLHTVMLPKSVLVHQPRVFMYSMEDRVLPRYRVFQLLIEKKLCKKVPSYIHLLCLSEEVFLDKYISQFRENAEELLVAYKGHYPEEIVIPSNSVSECSLHEALGNLGTTNHVGAHPVLSSSFQLQ